MRDEANKVDDKKRRHGPWILYYSKYRISEGSNAKPVEGRVFSKGTYIHGLKEGLWTEYLPNGILKTEEIYKNGLLHGISCYYYDNGNLSCIMKLHLGKLKGKEIALWENGNIQSKAFYGNDKILRPVKHYNEQGEIIREEMFIE